MKIVLRKENVVKEVASEDLAKKLEEKGFTRERTVPAVSETKATAKKDAASGEKGSVKK